MSISFKEFLELDKETQRQLGNMVNEELNQSVKKKKMMELEKLLKSAVWWGFMSDDSRAYKKWKEKETKIKALRDLIGSDSEHLYKIYAKKAGVMEHKNTNPPTPEKVNEVRSRHSIFPEMETSQRSISLGFGDGKVLENQHHFCNGDPYETTTKWTEPTKRNKYD
jgi:hypothetical protein